MIFSPGSNPPLSTSCVPPPSILASADSIQLCMLSGFSASAFFSSGTVALAGGPILPNTLTARTGEPPGPVLKTSSTDGTACSPIAVRACIQAILTHGWGSSSFEASAGAALDPFGPSVSITSAAATTAVTSPFSISAIRASILLSSCLSVA